VPCRTRPRYDAGMTAIAIESPERFIRWRYLWLALAGIAVMTAQQTGMTQEEIAFAAEIDLT
jgi:hypothetical protein